MKKILLALLALGALTMLAVSCDLSGSDDDEGDTYSVSFKIDGKAYSFTKGLSKNEAGTALTGEACAFYSKGEMTIAGLSSPYDATTGGELVGDHVSLQMYPFTSTGKYEADDVDMIIGESDCDEAEKPDGSNDFEIVVSKYDAVGGVVEGTFSGKIVDSDTNATKSVTDGTFKVIRMPDDSVSGK